jgi:adenosylcobinamide-phosphate synthase
VKAHQLAVAYAIDVAAGDPEWFPHPVRFFGGMIRAGDALRRTDWTPVQELVAGGVLAGAVVSLAWRMGRWRQPAGQVLLAWTTLATRSLLDEADAVLRALEANDPGLAQIRLARIVGRDTQGLKESEIARAVIETLAESACDGIVAPLFWLTVGGLPFAMAYKAINTLDSMIGHREPPYTYFGRAAARLDDAANFLPARLTAVTIAAAAKLAGLDAHKSLTIWRRDGDRHASPNAGQSEAAMAGALGVRLGGINCYDGRPHASPVLHAEGQLPGAAHARDAMVLVAAASVLAFAASLGFLLWRQT